MNTTYRHGALHVIESVGNKDDLQRSLKRIDDRLFLERQVTFTGEVVWCVCCEVGGDLGVITLLEWRDEHDVPLELSSGILHRMERMERDGGKLAQQVMLRNQEMIQMKRKEAQDAYREIAKDMIPRIEGRSRTILHRSQALRMSRDKHRASGKKV